MWVIVELVELDPVWVWQKAGTLITNSPTALDPMLVNPKMRGIERRAFLEELRQDVDDSVIRAGVVSVLDDKAPPSSAP